MKNQRELQASYNAKDSIENLFGQMETGQEFTIAGNYPFYNYQLADMGVIKILTTQEYTHAYWTWKKILANERTWVSFKDFFQEECLYKEDI